jgi:hypothetical protein
MFKKKRRRSCGFMKSLCNWHRMFELLTTVICLFFRSNIINILSLIALFILAPFSKSTNRIAAHARNTTLLSMYHCMTYNQTVVSTHGGFLTCHVRNPAWIAVRFHHKSCSFNCWEACISKYKHASMHTMLGH